MAPLELRQLVPIVDGASHNRFLRSITQRQQRDCRIVGVRCKGGPIDNTVTGIPSTARAGAVDKHLDAAINTRRDVFQTTARTGKLAECENCECSRNNPADRIREPGPAILVRVEANVAIGSTKFPFPKPIRFFAGTVQHPMDALQPCGYRRHQIPKSSCRQRSDPAAVLIVSGEDWPTAIRVLRAEQEALSTCDVTYRRRAECERGVACWLNCWLRRRCKCGPASTPLILHKSRMRKRARTDLRRGRSAMVVPTATT